MIDFQMVHSFFLGVLVGFVFMPHIKDALSCPLKIIIRTYRENKLKNIHHKFKVNLRKDLLQLIEFRAMEKNREFMVNIRKEFMMKVLEKFLSNQMNYFKWGQMDISVREITEQLNKFMVNREISFCEMVKLLRYFMKELLLKFMADRPLSVRFMIGEFGLPYNFWTRSFRLEKTPTSEQEIRMVELLVLHLLIETNSYQSVYHSCSKAVTDNRKERNRDSDICEKLGPVLSPHLGDDLTNVVCGFLRPY